MIRFLTCVFASINDNVIGVSSSLQHSRLRGRVRMTAAGKNS